MKNKFSTRFAGRRGFCPAVVSTQTRVGQHGFINLRALLGLTLGLSGVALAIFAGKDGALQRPSEPERYMPVPGGDSRDEAANLGQLEQYWHDRLTLSDRPVRSRMGASCRGATCTDDHRRPSGTTSEA